MSIREPARDGLAILVLACLPFLASLGGGFVYDDVPLVQEDARVREGDLVAALTEPYWGERHGGLYRPLTTASFVLGGKLSSAPWSFRVTNLALHAGASVLALVLARRLLERRAPAFLAAAVFAVHPIHVEVAANVVGRAESLAFLLAAGAWALLLDRSHRVQARRLVAAAVLASLGALAKESAVAVALAAPLEVLLLAPRPRGRQVALAAVPALVAVVVALGLRIVALGPERLAPLAVGVHPLVNPLAAAPLLERVANVPVLFLWYVRNLAFPVALAPDYGGATLPLVTTITWSALGWSLAAALVLVVPAVLGGRRAAFGALFGLLALAPVLQLVPIGILAGDRLAYAASFGFALVAGLALAALGARSRNAGRVAAVAWCGWFALIAAQDAHAWSESFRLFERARTRVPLSFQMPYVQGALRVRRGENELALEPLSAAHALAPDDGEVLLLLGQTHRQLGHAAEARGFLEHALALGVREEGKARVQLGLLLVELDELTAAEPVLARACELAPADGELQLLLADVERRLGRRERASVLYERALELGVAEEAAARVRLGLLLVELGKLGAAERELRRATELEPHVAAWFEGLGEILKLRGDAHGARAAFERCLALDPDRLRAEEIRRWLGTVPP